MTTSSPPSVTPSEILRPALKRDSSRLGLSDALGSDNPETPRSSSGSGYLALPVPGYTNKVSFDTLEGNTPADTSMFSFTLKVRSR